jgi:putative phosphoesterase
MIVPDRIPLRDGPALRLAVVADTHSSPQPGTLDQLRALAPDAILHAGDIGDLAVLDALREVAPLYAIRGNIDVHRDDIPDHRTIDLVVGEHVLLRILLTHIAVAGPRLHGNIVTLAKQAAAKVVICGHSHVPFVGEDRGLTIFNPGSCGPRRFSLPIVFGTIEITAGKLRFGHLDAATGTPWTP